MAETRSHRVPSRWDRHQLEQWDDRYLWHPFTPQSVYREEEPLLIASGEGCYLVDVDGKRYLDGVGSLWCNLLGHRRPEIDSAVRSQLDQIAHATLLGNSSVPAIRLARRLAKLAPDPLTRVFYSDSGSTAVEVALKMALQFWQQHAEGEQSERKLFLGLSEAYHGDTVGSVSLGGIDLFHRRFGPLLFDVVRVPSPTGYRWPEGFTAPTYQRHCTEVMERTIREQGQRLAAVVVEPGFQGAAGILTYPEGYLERLASVTREVGALLIFDEVAVGMGRSGSLFACQREGVVPDLLCLAKGLTGGYLPLAATLATEEIYEAFLGAPEAGRTFFHGHTYTGNALGCAAALATLDVLENERLLEGLPLKCDYLRRALDRLRSRPAVGQIRQYGLAVGIELVSDRKTKEPFPAADRVGPRVCRSARDRGVFLRPLGDVVVLMPPITISRRQTDQLVDAVEHGIREVLG